MAKITVPDNVPVPPLLDPDLIRIGDAADIMTVSYERVRQIVAKGDLVAIDGFVSRRDVLDYYEAMAARRLTNAEAFGRQSVIKLRNAKRMVNRVKRIRKELAPLLKRRVGAPAQG
jgi:hypothetical protein